jgi:NAD(P)-dependent dehydrogenase (short-subunit alcohol dehydrogenase family)
MKNWLITGCDKGLGYAMAEAALKRGDSVAITLLAKDGKSELVEKYAGRCHAFHLDVRDHDAIRRVVSDAERSLGRIDVLVNNAGYGVIGAAEETTEEEYRPMFEVNFFGTVEVTKAVLPGMRQRRSGRIICFSSLVGFVAFPGFSLYSASKFAVEGFGESLSKEVQPFGIYLTLIEPGGFRTDFAGGSLTRAAMKIDAYSETASTKMREYMDTRNGVQPGDPVRLGAAICQVVDAAEPPLRLPLGADALPLVEQKAAFVAQEASRWRELSLSTGFDAA